MKPSSKFEFYDITTRKGLLKKIDKAKERFLAGEEMQFIPDQIVMDSWERSKNQQISTEMNKAQIILTEEQIQLKYFNKPWVKVAIETLKETQRIPNHIIILSDVHGRVLWLEGEKSTLRKAYSMNLIPGGDWNENAVGTNAIGTSALIDKPMQIIGTEHFCEGWQCWTCSAAPIHNPETKKIRGIVNITGLIEYSSPYLINVSVTIAKKIEAQLKNQEMILQSQLIDEYYSSINKWGEYSNGILVTNKHGRIVKINYKAQKTLFESNHNLNLDANTNNLNTILKEIHGKEKNTLSLTDNIEIQIDPIKYQGQEIGSLLILSEKHSHNITLPKSPNKMIGFEKVITKNQDFQGIIQKTKRLANYDINVLIEGESGTGKELFANAIHSESSRANQPFISVNCGAIPKDLIASELFGYDEGSFTGASKSGKKGVFELAHKGTIFLDEIGEMPLDLQVYLLRVLQEKEFKRLGGNKTISVDVRVIAATNKNLQEKVKNGEFRKDLYYRINSANIKIPPLRDRKDDIPYLSSFLLQRFYKDSKEAISVIDQQVMEILCRYDWPGNVRQLSNAIEYMTALSNGDKITIEHLPDFLVEYYIGTNNKHTLIKSHVEHNVTISDNFTNIITDHTKSKDIEEKEILEQMIVKHKGNLSAVARELNISRPTLYKKIKKYNISVIRQY